MPRLREIAALQGPAPERLRLMDGLSVARGSG
jgi:hypothetical protein